MDNKSKTILLASIVILSIFISGCADGGQDITPIFNSLPEVQQFLQEHPNAKITVTYWTEEEITKISDEINIQCDKNINPRALYKATISEGDLKIISWIDAETQIVICTTSQEFSLSQPTSIETSTANPIETYTSTPSYEPSLTLSKEVDKSSVNIGDTIRVTIKARNTGSGTAQRISIDPGITPGFTFKSNIYSTYPTELAVGTSYTQMYIYEIEAAKGGTFTLSPAIATYSSSVFEDDYTTPSTRPTVTVAEEAVETSNLSLTISQDKTKLKRGEKITFTINVENFKDVPASTIKITPVIPNNLTYLSGSEDIDIINEKPIIQKSVFGARYEDEYKFTLRADEVGANILTVKLTYNNGVEDISQEVTSNMFYVEKGKYDSLAEYPIYVYITPVIIIIAIAGWLHWRRSQFRM